MARLETNNIIASSLDNFIIFDNPDHSELPYVNISINQGNVGQTITLTFEDADDPDAAKVVLEGTPDANITSRTFNTSGGVQQLMFSLMECLKMNSIVYDVHPVTPSMLNMGLDSSRKWSITGNFSIGGNYTSYDPNKIQKWVLMVNTTIDSEATQFSMEKYNNNQQISFNVSAPFAYITSKFPFTIGLAAYSVNGGSVSMQSITNNQLIVMPTTLDKFETVDYSRYFLQSGNSEKKDFLTRNFLRDYNYDEYVGLSVLTDRNSITLTRKFYTNSGMFLTSSSGYYRKEYKNSRVDFYVKFDINTVENQFDHQVGYIDVVATDGGVELTNPVRFVVNPKCDKNDTLFFINAIGGLDSYNFTGEHRFESDINERVTYMKNPQRPFTTLYELEHTKQVEIDQSYTSKTSLVNEKMANWLNELQRSKYVFKLIDGKFYMVLIDEMNIDLSDNEKYFEIECKYRYADTGINV